MVIGDANSLVSRNFSCPFYCDLLSRIANISLADIMRQTADFGYNFLTFC